MFKLTRAQEKRERKTKGKAGQTAAKHQAHLKETKTTASYMDISRQITPKLQHALPA